MRISTRASVIAAAVVILVAGLSVASAAGRSPMSVLSLLHQPTSAYPSVAMVINGHAISGSAINEDVAAGEANGLSHSAAIQAAVDRAINRELLYEEAVRRGFGASDAEVTAWFARQVDAANQHPEIASTVQDVLAANGDTDLQAYTHDPAVRAHIKRLITSTKLLNSLYAQDPNFDLAAFESGLRTKANIDIRFPH
jgi:hypothetical protein